MLVKATARRFWLIGFVGGVLGLTAFVVSRVSTGHVGALAFMVALCVGSVTLGLVIAMAVEAWIEKPLVSSVGRTPRPSLLRRMGPLAARVRCGQCRNWMTPVQSIWVCPICDGAVAGG
jgi:hypothetical protein